jgi:hypothetical protein
MPANIKDTPILLKERRPDFALVSVHIMMSVCNRFQMKIKFWSKPIKVGYSESFLLSSHRYSSIFSLHPWGFLDVFFLR